MQRLSCALPALLIAGSVAAQECSPEPLNAQAKAPPVQFRSAFEGYQPFVEQQPIDWRTANEEVAAAGGHGGHRAGQGEGQQTSKPQPGKPADHEGHHK